MSPSRWLLLLAITLLLAGISRSWGVAWVFYSLAALVVLALAIAWRPAKLREARRRMSTSHAEIGQEVIVDVALTWDRPVGAGWVLARDDTAPALDCTPPGRLFVAGGTSQTSFSYRVTAPGRGYYPLGPLTVASGDLFGIASGESADAVRDYLTVYPSVLPVPAIRLPSNRPVGDVRLSRHALDDPTRMVGVRDYQPGDSLTKIHWKSTAHRGELTSKIYEPSSEVEVTMVLNLSRADYPEEEAEGVIELACVSASSLAAGLLIDHRVVGLQSNGRDAAQTGGFDRRPPAVKTEWSTMQLPAIRALLARLEPSDDMPLHQYLMRIHSGLPWTATLLLITHGLREEAAQVLEGLLRSGFALSLIIVGEGEMAREAMDRATLLNIMTARVQTEAQLGVLEFWRPA